MLIIHESLILSILFIKFKKISHNFITNRNGMDLTEEEDIKKRWQEHTEELYKKDFSQPR